MAEAGLKDLAGAIGPKGIRRFIVSPSFSLSLSILRNSSSLSSLSFSSSLLPFLASRFLFAAVAQM